MRRARLIWKGGAGNLKQFPMVRHTRINPVAGSLEPIQTEIDYNILADKIAERMEKVLLKFTGGLHAGLLAALESREIKPGHHPKYINNPSLGSPIFIDESIIDVGVSSTGLENPNAEESLGKSVTQEDTQLSSLTDKLKKLKGK